MGLPFWDPVATVAEGPLISEDEWDVVSIAGWPLPGVCRVKGLPTLAFDKKKAGGVDGATVTVNGYLPGPIDIECMIWTDPQWQYFQEIAKDIWRKPNKKSKAAELAVAISHPATDLWNINSVVVLGVSVPEDGPLVGSKIIKIKAVEYVPTVNKSKTKTAVGSRTTVPLAKELDPARNRAGEAPSKTDINPGGKAVSHKGGTS